MTNTEIKTNIDDEIDVEETEMSEEEERDIISYDISYYPTDFTLKGYLDKLEAGHLVIPDYQRRYVWSQTQASKLIESFLLGLPVPGVFLYKDRTSKKLQIIDGQQRIISAIRYFKQEFDRKPFRLTGVQDKWEGKTFRELTEDEQIELHDTVLRATVIQQLEPTDNSSVYLIFERLNTGGTKLTPMEIRKCVYHGEFFNILEECNHHEHWRLLLGKQQKDKRLRDVEFILRVMAFREKLDEYSKPMKKFLNDYMLEVRDKSSAELSVMKQEFKETASYLYDQLGEKPFHIHSRVNYAALDSVFVSAYVAREKNIKDIAERYESLKHDEDFILHISKSTSDEKSVNIRFNKADIYLCE